VKQIGGICNGNQKQGRGICRHVQSIPIDKVGTGDYADQTNMVGQQQQQQLEHHLQQPLKM